MNKNIKPLIFLSLLLLCSFQRPLNDLIKTKITENIEVGIPKAFQPMTEELMDQRYLTARKPIAAYTNDRQTVDFTVSTSNTRWRPSDLPILKDFYKASLLELYDEVSFSREEVEEINGKNFVVFEFSSIVRPEENALAPQQPIRKYTRIQYTVHNGKTLVFNFSSPQAQQQQWEGTAAEMMQSIQIK
ncbi:hypothetical protein [Catalinimonas niigatensis]|uniref:hypothetical protein n=1 Tax=Catalinimonas niigatensis TaxID=1397264 RepID=UPI002664F141|nr:hypothetical protein [Catalinimonas niigatensis]WPP48496.1 hypothetical protein PZB72_17635 [Catalinimonas niigatensis]